jgi:multiple antibiotic resistance protein
MGDMFSDFWVDFATLMSVMNPIAVIPVYVSVTARLDSATRLRVLVRAIVVALVILLVFLTAGEIALAELGVGLDAFRIAGGLVLLLIGLRMVFDEGGNAGPAAADSERSHRDIAIFPLAMPMIAGPGAVMSIVLLTRNDLHNATQQAGTAIVLCLVLAINLVVLGAAGPVQRFIGTTGISVMSRVTGLILTALAAQSIITGIKDSF